MKNVVRILIGLIFDDWWLGLGLLLSIAVTYIAVAGGMNQQTGGWLLLLCMLGTLILSLVMEYRRRVKA